MALLAKVLEKEEFGVRQSAHRPIDMVHLSRQSLGDPGLEEEILRMFDQLVETYMGRIRETVDSEAIRFNLHSLKGASAGVGAFSVFGLAETAEIEFKQMGKLSGERLADLGMAIEEVRGFIAELLQD